MLEYITISVNMFVQSTSYYIIVLSLFQNNFGMFILLWIVLVECMLEFETSNDNYIIIEKPVRKNILIYV